MHARMQVSFSEQRSYMYPFTILYSLQHCDPVRKMQLHSERSCSACMEADITTFQWSSQALLSPHLHGFTSFSAASQHTGQEASQLGCILRGSLAQLGHCLEALGGQLRNGLGCHVRQHHQAGLIPPAPLHHKGGGCFLAAVPEPTGTMHYRPSGLWSSKDTHSYMSLCRS